MNTGVSAFVAGQSDVREFASKCDSIPHVDELVRWSECPDGGVASIRTAADQAKLCVLAPYLLGVKGKVLVVGGPSVPGMFQGGWAKDNTITKMPFLHHIGVCASSEEMQRACFTFDMNVGFKREFPYLPSWVPRVARIQKGVPPPKEEDDAPQNQVFWINAQHLATIVPWAPAHEMLSRDDFFELIIVLRPANMGVDIWHPISRWVNTKARTLVLKDAEIPEVESDSDSESDDEEVLVPAFALHGFAE